MTQSSAVNARVQLGALLTRLADAASCTRADVRRVLDCGETKVRKIMSGQSGVHPEELDVLLDAFAATAEDRKQAHALAGDAQRRQPRQPGGIVLTATFYRLEASAIAIRGHGTDLVPGALQTEDYARAIFNSPGGRDPGQVDKWVDARLERREHLLAPGGPTLHFVLGEGAISWHVGGPQVMRDQLKFLVELQELPQVTVQVLPFASGAYGALGQPFVILCQPGGSPDRVYVENLVSSQLVTDEKKVDRCKRRFEQVAQRALDASASSAFLDRLAARL